MISQYDGAKIQQTEKTYEEYKKLWKQINELYAKSEDFDSVDAKIQVWNEIDDIVDTNITSFIAVTDKDKVMDLLHTIKDKTEKLDKSIMLIASIVIFIVLEIPKVIGALTGKSARKGIAAIVQKQTAVHIDITSSGPIAPSYNLAGEDKKKPGYTQKIDETTVLAAPTEVLQDETIVLEDITEKLQKTNIRFEVTKKIEFIHTTECIS